MCGGIGVSRAGCRFESLEFGLGRERGMRGRQGSSARNLGRRSLPLSNSRAGTCQTKAEIRLALRLASLASVRVARARQERLPLANGFGELTRLHGWGPSANSMEHGDTYHVEDGGRRTSALLDRGSRHHHPLKRQEGSRQPYADNHGDKTRQGLVSREIRELRNVDSTAERRRLRCFGYHSQK